MRSISVTLICQLCVNRVVSIMRLYIYILFISGQQMVYKARHDIGNMTFRGLELFCAFCH